MYEHVAPVVSTVRWHGHRIVYSAATASQPTAVVCISVSWLCCHGAHTISPLGLKNRHGHHGCPGCRLLTLLGPESRFGDTSVKLCAVCPPNGTAVLKGLRTHSHTSDGPRKPPLCLQILFQYRVGSDLHVPSWSFHPAHDGTQTAYISW